VIVGDGECHQRIKVDFLLAKPLDKARCDIRELETATHDERRHAEQRRHVLHALAVVHQLLERLELIRRAHVLPLHVLRETRGHRALAVDDGAGNREIGLDLALLQKRLQGREAPPARDDGIAVCCLLLLGHDEALQDALGENRIGESVDVRAGRLAHIIGGDAETRERNRLILMFNHG